MLKRRVIPTFLINSNRIVKGINFKNYRDVGEPTSNIKIFNSQKSDEIIFININKDKNIENLKKILKSSSEYCFMPMTAGGGIGSIKDIKDLLDCGADKISINQKISEDLNFLKKSSKEFGSQCIVVGIDIKKINNEYRIFVNNGKKIIKYNLLDYIKKCDDFGAGEFYINNIDRDGTKRGYDLELIKKIEKSTDLPIIYSGGAGNLDHIYKLFKYTRNVAAACSSIFCFGDNNPIRIRSYLRNKKIDVKSG